MVSETVRAQKQQWTPVQGRTGLSCWRDSWDGRGVGLPKECPYAYRIAFVVKRNGTVIPLQHCVQVKYEERHSVGEDVWPFPLEKYDTGLKWPDAERILDEIAAELNDRVSGAMQIVRDQKKLDELFGLAGDVRVAFSGARCLEKDPHTGRSG